MGCGASKPQGGAHHPPPKAPSSEKQPALGLLMVDHSLDDDDLSRSLDIPYHDDQLSRSEFDSNEQHRMWNQETDNSVTGQAIRMGYPPPKPPTKRKDEIFIAREYTKIDKRASKVNEEELNKSFEEVAQYLTKNCKTDLQKARAIFIFITSIDLPALERSAEDLPEPGTTLDYLLKIHWQMGNHAHLFTMLARAAGLPSLVLTGLNKSAAYQVGGTVDRAAMTAQWNTVCLDGEWRLVDVYWASTCIVGGRSGDWSLIDADGTAAEESDGEEEEGETIQQINEFFFLTDPDQLISTHLPDEDEWQLSEIPRTLEEFETFVYIRERFFQCGMSFLPESVLTCDVPTKKGECVLSFASPPELAGRLQFRYLLYKSRQRGEKPPKIPIERFVFFQKSSSVMRCTARFPIGGKFKMDIFGQVDKEQESFELICSYLITCNDPQSSFEPLPDMPDIGWGPGAEIEKAGLVPTSHNEAVIETKDGMVEVRFAADEAKSFVQSLKHNELEDFNLGKHGCIREENGEIIINLRLPGKGDYALNLFADSANIEGDIPNVCNYLVKCLGINENNAKPFPKFHDSKLGYGYLAKKLGIKALSHEGGIIDAPDGKVKASFEAAGDVELICEMHHTDIDRTMLSGAVERNTSGKETDFDILLPSTGEYAMNVFARKKDDPDRIFHVHTYMVKSGQGHAETVLPNKKDAPVVTLYSSDEYTEVPIPAGKSPMVAELQRKNAQDTPKPKQITSTNDGTNAVFKAHLPDLGEYNLHVYDKKTESSLVHRCTVQIVRTEPSPEMKSAKPAEEDKPQTPQEQLSPEEIERRRIEKEQEGRYRSYREQLKAAMSSQDPAQLQVAIHDHEENHVPERNNDLTKAKEQLSYFTISLALSTAMSTRNMKQLQEALGAAEKAGLHKRLNLQMQMARKILEQLRRIEKLRHAVLNLDQKTIAEIKSYSQPPEAVHEVMAATFLLLGDREKLLREWKQVQIFIGKTGKESLKRRVTEFNVDRLDIHLAVKAQHILKRFNLDEVRDVSAGVATFYIWSTGMAEEREARFEQDGGDLSSLQNPRPKTRQKGKGGKS